MQIPASFFRKIFWVLGSLLILMGIFSFYVRFQTIKYDLRQTGYETTVIEAGE